MPLWPHDELNQAPPSGELTAADVAFVPEGTVASMTVQAAIAELDGDIVAIGPGANGDPGSVWYSGAGAPDGGLGIVGDYYLRDTGLTYSKTGAATWTEGINIKGANGAAGTDITSIVYQASAPSEPATGTLWIESDVEIPVAESPHPFLLAGA